MDCSFKFAVPIDASGTMTYYYLWCSLLNRTGLWPKIAYNDRFVESSGIRSGPHSAERSVARTPVTKRSLVWCYSESVVSESKIWTC